MGFFGKLLGGLAGSLGSALLPTYDKSGKQIDGAAIGRQIGDVLPFQEGGMVPPSSRVFNTGQMVPVRKRKRSYQKTKKTKKSKK